MITLRARSLVKTLTDGRRHFRVDIPEFSLGPGDRKAIVGTTGSGKTTAMDVLALASPPNRARVFELRTSEGVVDLAGVREPDGAARLRARHFGYVLQSNPLFPFLTYEENVSFAQRLSGRRDPAFVAGLAARLGLTFGADTRVADLSTGQRQRVAVVRALAHRPDFVLCDEPTAALDPATAELLVDTVLDVADAIGAAVLLITHDPALVTFRGFDLFEMVLAPEGTGAILQPLEDGR